MEDTLRYRKLESARQGGWLLSANIGPAALRGLLNENVAG